MNRRRLIAACVALCLALTGGLNPAFAGGLVSTERVVDAVAAPAPTRTAGPALSPEAERMLLTSALVAAGVERAQAETRLAALTDAEVGQLRQNIDTAPAGGLWFVPFLLVAAVIGALIGSRESSGKTTTDLFGHPRVATAP